MEISKMLETKVQKMNDELIWRRVNLRPLSHENSFISENVEHNYEVFCDSNKEKIVLELIPGLSEKSQILQSATLVFPSRDGTSSILRHSGLFRIHTSKVNFVIFFVIISFFVFLVQQCCRWT